jgi:hypothetical protein
LLENYLNFAFITLKPKHKQMQVVEIVAQKPRGIVTFIVHPMQEIIFEFG